MATDAVSSFASLSIEREMGMMGALSGMMGVVCGSGGNLKTVAHGKESPNLCLAVHDSSALLDCISLLSCSALPSFLAPSRAG